MSIAADTVAPPPLLDIRDLRVKVAGQEVLRGISLIVRAGEVHAIMGPNGSGKSTLAHVLAGRPGYEIVSGSASFEGRDLFALAPEERARAGLFLGFQYPVEIPGVNNAYLLKAALNAARRERGLAELDAFEFLAVVRAKIKLMQIDESFLSRGVNEGFSGGEKKRNEILQMLVLEPKLALLDETDSGPGHRCAQGRRQWHQFTARRRACHRAGDALPAPARLRGAGLRARAGARPHRAQRRSHAGAGTREARLRLDQRAGCRLTDPAMTSPAATPRSDTLDRILRDYEAVAAPAAGRGRAARGGAATRCVSCRVSAGQRPATSSGATPICAPSRACRGFDRRCWRRQRGDGAPARPALELPPPLPGFERLVYVDGVRAGASATAAAIAGPDWPAEQRLGLLCDMFASDVAALRIRGTAAIEVLFLTSAAPPAPPAIRDCR